MSLDDKLVKTFFSRMAILGVVGVAGFLVVDYHVRPKEDPAKRYCAQRLADVSLAPLQEQENKKAEALSYRFTEGSYKGKTCKEILGF